MNASQIEGINMKNDKEKSKRRARRIWITFAFIFSFVMTALLSLLSGEALEDLPVWAALAVLLIFILLGIAFDMIGLAVTTADMAAFNAMAAKKDPVGKRAVWLIANAEKVSSFCNDIVGDICGVVSGASAASIAVVLFSNLNPELAFWLTLSLTALVSSVTVGGKALGKKVGIEKSRQITLFTAKFLCIFTKK